MKIIHCVMSKEFSGIERHVHELALEQSKLHEVLILTNLKISKYFINNKIIKCKNLGRKNPFLIFFLIKTLKKEKPDIVHTHGNKTTNLINAVKKFIKFKHVATLHSIKSKVDVFLKADLIIGVSNSIQELFKTKIHIIENWYNPIFINRYKGNNHKNYFLAVGRLEKVKNFSLLISCWKSQNKKLLIVGSGPEKTRLIRLIKKTKQENFIKIIDKVSLEDLKEYYSNAKAILIPSKKEGGPRVALEALAMGKPIFSMNVGDIKNIIPKEFISNSCNEKSFKELIDNNMDILDCYQFDRIQDYIIKEYSLKRKCQETLQVYSSLVTDS